MKRIKTGALSIIALVLLAGCAKKPEIGFLSDNLLYAPYVFNAVKGRVTVSRPIEVDGSSGPINVKLLAIRNKATGQPAPEMLEEHEIAVYLGEITPADTTLEKVRSKIGVGKYKPFNINPLGGRLEVTPASNFVPEGTYVFDVEVSNMVGKKTLLNAGEVKILPATTPYELISHSVTTSVPGNETTFTGQTSNVTVTHTPSTNNRIIFKFVDKNGVPFNPKTDVITRIDRPFFDQLNPFYDPVNTDTAIVYQYPDLLPTFPLFQSIVGATNYGYLSYYRIAASSNDMNVNLNPTVAFRTWPAVGESVVKGEYLVTLRFNFVAKK